MLQRERAVLQREGWQLLCWIGRNTHEDIVPLYAHKGKMIHLNALRPREWRRRAAGMLTGKIHGAFREQRIVPCSAQKCGIQTPPLEHDVHSKLGGQPINHTTSSNTSTSHPLGEVPSCAANGVSTGIFFCELLPRSAASCAGCCCCCALWPPSAGHNAVISASSGLQQQQCAHTMEDACKRSHAHHPATLCGHTCTTSLQQRLQYSMQQGRA